MVKIKRKVEMTLPKLIEWAWKNNLEGKTFYSNIDGGYVYFDIEQTLSIEHSIDKDETFTVEVEEEITEETKINKLVEVYRNIEDTILFTDLHHDYSIGEVKDNEKYAVCSRAFYILNDDFNMTLIWKDGELVGDE